MFFPKKSSSISDSKNEPFSLPPPSLSPLSGGLVTSTPLPPPISTCAEHHQSPTMPYSFEHLHTHTRNQRAEKRSTEKHSFFTYAQHQPPACHDSKLVFFTYWYMVYGDSGAHISESVTAIGAMAGTLHIVVSMCLLGNST